MSRDDRGTEDSIRSFGHMHLHESSRFAIDNGAIHVLESFDKRLNIDVTFLCLPFADPHVSQLGFRVSAPWNCQLARFGAAEEQRILNYDPGHGVCGMCEFSISGADVARGKDPRMARPQSVVDLNSRRPRLDPSRFQTEVLDIRCASRCDQDLIHSDIMACTMRLDRELDIRRHFTDPK